MEKVKITPNDFDNYLNDTYKEAKILGLEFAPSQILFECDPIAYRIYCQDFIDEMEKEANE